MSSYDGEKYDKFSKSGFLDYMEGFNVLSDDQDGHQMCSENQLCLCETGGPQCEGSEASRPIVSLLYNSVE